MQAITTRYLCPTNTKGARIVAEADAGRRVYGWDHREDVHGNHLAAGSRYALEMGWIGDGARHQLASGMAKGGMGVHIPVAIY